ncbi:MAG TPA: bifunctional 4-hydroxy-2-oxoglutarate aldolase/2-dehydro-3-deoxy-phosphogluconate aldolase [Chitinophagaceae bacterium]|jgi:2-dehydro-3-deoxyphosphogluconate aldolase/(4S)-4-hydroxy-2-oxoglutarate aldolase
MKTKEKVLEIITQQGVLPLFYYPDVEVSMQAIITLYKAGIRAMEFTNRAEGALEVYTEIRKAVAAEMADMLFGAGTIRTVKDAVTFFNADADFFVAPNLNEGVGSVAHNQNMLWIPGCMTPSEIHLAREQQAALIKIFPANVLGPGFISAVKEVFPGQPFLPTGGVEISKENLSAWFRSGVVAVGMGSKLVSKEILKNKSWNELFDKTKEVLEIIKEVRK